MRRFLLATLMFLCFSNTSYAFITATYNTSKKLVSSLEHKVVGYVQKTIDSLRYSHYKMGGSHFDPKKGVYIVDCSNYVDQILQNVSPHAYLSLVNSCGVETPTTQHYYDFFSDLSSNQPYWGKIDDVENLRPGDIIVFRYRKHHTRHGAMRGHVMVVMDKPIRADNTYLLRVADSAPVGHSQDTRPKHVSGIGIGTLLLKINPKNGHPNAYAWRDGSLWEHNVSFAMARPMDMLQ